MKKLFLIDAYALIYRMYYAFLNRPMRNTEGVNTSPVFGFVKFLREIVRRENPHYLGVAFDSKGDTFRHEMFPAYKANRDATPEDIHASVPYIKRVLAAMRIPCIERQGWEADDLIGTLSCKAESAGFEVYMVTPDKDYGQLVRPNAYIYKQRKSGEGVEIVGCDRIREVYGVDDPRLIIDILALWGDASDNIPGVPGIGEKSAIKLVCEFGTVEQILENADKLKGKQKENILANREQLLLSKKLATIDTDAPVEFDPEALIMEEPNREELVEVYRELGFSSFIREVGAGTRGPADSPAVRGNADNGAAAGGMAADNSAFAPASKPGNGGQGDLFGGDLFSPAAGTSAGSDGQAEDAADVYRTAADTPHTYHIVRDEAQLAEMIAELRSGKEFCFDTETTGFDVFNDRIVGVSFAVKAHQAWYVPLDRTNHDRFLELMRPLFADGDIAKVGQNIKFDIMVLANAGIEVRGFKYDTMLLHYLLDPESRHGMNFLSRTYLNYAPIEIETLIGKGARQITMDMVPVEKCAEYAAEDADVTMQLKQILWQQVVSEGLTELYGQIEEPMVDVLAAIELTGVKIDAEILAQSGEALNARLAGLEDRIREAAGEPGLNVNSAKQLGEALFGKMKIDPKPKMTKTKQYRTDEEYLQSLADRNPIIGLILEYRGIKKLLSTYIEALPQLVNPKTGRVHTSYNQAVTATGRLSSSNPNLQNIPVRDDQGREIRKAFVPSDDEHLLLSADYSQVELRLMAHLSGDENLIEAFLNGEDIHAATAARLYGVALAEVTPEQRRRAKTANFGIIYGISAFGLSQRLNIPRTEAKEIIDNYFVSYPGVKRYMDDVIEQAREQGYVTTLRGRKRWLRDIRSANATTRGLAERNAINAPIQGGAADIMKAAMIEVDRRFREANLRSRVIMQVHDELVVDLLKSEQQQVVGIVTSAMEGAAALRVPLTVDYGIGSNWLEAH